MPGTPLTRRTLLAATGAATAAGTLATGLPASARARTADDPPPREPVRPVPYTPYLFTRYRDSLTDLATLDDGRAANGAVPPAAVFWLSPDIRVEPADSLGNPTAGVPTSITAFLTNAGRADAFAVLVEFFWFNPSLAFVAGNANRIGSRLVALPDHGYTPVTCPTPWRPTVVNGGHECVVVQLSTPEEGPGGLRFPYDASRDRHVGQRNLTVRAATRPQSLGIRAANPFTTPATFALLLTSTAITANLTALRQLTPQAAATVLASATPGTRTSLLQATDATGTDFGVRVSQTQQVPGQPGPGSQSLAEHVQARQAAGGPAAAGRSLAQIPLTPGAGATVTVTVPAVSLASGQYLVHRFVQATSGVAVGGYAVVLAAS
jgi:hypothetical protein